MAAGAGAASRARTLDLVGVLLVAASVGWTFRTAASGGGDPFPVAALQLGCAVAYAAARAATRRQRPLVPVAVVAGVASAVVIGSAVPSLAPLGPPLGYANANAALYVLAAVAAVMAASAFRAGPATGIALPMALAFAVAAVVSRSVTGAVVLLMALGILRVSRVTRSVRAPVIACALVVQVVVAVTALLGVARIEGRSSAITERLVDSRRVLLWRDAAMIVRSHPLAGTGPGRFRELSPTARSDPDAHWAHSGFLQQAAEQGAVGLVLLLGAFGWGFARLWSAPRHTFAVCGVVVLVALGLHASVDYVLHFAAVPLTAAALVGAAGAPRRDTTG